MYRQEEEETYHITVETRYNMGGDTSCDDMQVALFYAVRVHTS